MNSQPVDLAYLLELMEASVVLSPEQKNWWKSKIPEMSDLQLVEFFRILEKEMQTRKNALEKEIEIRKTYAHKKIKAVYDYIEKKVEEEEEVELALLDRELETISQQN
jgi:hypothetical protein